jgi:hypothetical protein
MGIIPANLDPLCPRVKKIFTLFSEHPVELQHLLLYGPPGAGKTSTVEWLLDKIWGGSHMKVQTCRTLNAADERSLDAIRAKIIPFVNADWREPGDKRPRFLVLDECETLTDSAQLALRPFLDNSPQDLCIIFICNSLSRVQMSLRSRCLRIRFDPPATNSLQTQSARGDLRGARIIRNDIAHWLAYIHAPPNSSIADFPLSCTECVQAALFFITSFGIADDAILTAVRPLLQLGVDGLPIKCIDKYFGLLKAHCLAKFETLDWGDLNITPDPAPNNAPSHKRKRASASTSTSTSKLRNV